MKNMRKNFALAVVALLSLTLALAALGCGQKTVEETPAPTTTTPPENMMSSDSTMMDSMMTDTSSMQH